MRAVNLLPVEARPVTGVSLRGLSASTTGLLSGLALAVVLVALFVVLENDVTSKQGQRDQLIARANALEARTTQLKPYVDLLNLRNTTVSKVRSLAGDRYDWPRTLAGIAQVLPDDVTLTQLDGEPGAASTTTTPAAAGATSAATGPTVKLTGCTSSHTEAGHTMDRLRLVPGVADVTLQSSTLPSAGGGGAPSASAGAAACPRPEQFQMTVQLQGAQAPASATSASAPTSAAPAGRPTTTSSSSATPAATSANASTSPGGGK